MLSGETVRPHEQPPPPAPIFPPCENGTTPSPCVQPRGAYRHDGFYLRTAAMTSYAAALGTGPAGHASVTGLGSGTLIGIGGNVTDELVLAGALTGTMTRNTFHGAPTEPEHNATVVVGTLGLLADWFFDPAGGWHAGAVAGLAPLQITEAQIRDAAGITFSGELFGGYDFWIGPEFSLSLIGFASATSSAPLKDVHDQHDTGYELHSFAFGIGYGILYH